MTKLFAVANQKGGVGKTTTTVNLAASMAVRGHKVLLVDLDPQSNASMAVGATNFETNVYDVLCKKKDIRSAIFYNEKVSFSLLPACRDLAAAEIELSSLPKSQLILRQALQSVKKNFDFIFIDCPPALGLLTLNGLSAAERVIIPMQCEYYALGGLADLVSTLRSVKKTFNRDLEIEGLVMTMFDNRSLLCRQVAKEVKQHFGDKVFKTVIPRNIRLAEAPSYGLPCVVFDRAARGSSAYLACADELLQRIKQEELDFVG